jgi:hypothetical protein
MQQQQLMGIGQGLGAVADYTQDKYLLEQLAQQPPQVQRPQQDPMEAVAGVFEEMGIDTPEKVDKLTNDFSAVVANPTQGVQILAQRANEIEARGGDASDTRMMAQQFQINPQAAMQEIRSIAQLAADPKIRAYMARNPARAKQTMEMMGVQGMGGGTGREGMASATTTTWKNGTTLFNLPNGKQRLVFQGQEITDPRQFAAVIDAANKSGLALAGEEAFTRASEGAKGSTSGQLASLPDKKKVIEETAVTEKLSAELANALSDIETFESNMPTLKDDLDYLKELNNIASYTAAGKALDWGMRQSGMYPREAARAAAEADAFVLTNVLPQLKPIFGGAISDSELQTLKATW